MDVYEHPLYERVVDVLLNYGRTPEGITSELAKDWVPRAALDAAQNEIRELTRQLESARDLAVRSGLFERRDCDCVFTRHGSDLCQVLTEEELHAAGVETDHSVGHDPGETCERCGGAS